jgi:hypothetical protein
MKDIIDRIKNMQYYTVEVEMNGPVEFDGVVPYDMTITDNIATVTVLAESKQDAYNKAFEYLRK